MGTDVHSIGPLLNGIKLRTKLPCTFFFSLRRKVDQRGMEWQWIAWKIGREYAPWACCYLVKLWLRWGLLSWWQTSWWRQHTCDHVVLRALPALDATEKQNWVTYSKFFVHTHQDTQTSGQFIPQVSCRGYKTEMNSSLVYKTNAEFSYTHENLIVQT